MCHYINYQLFKLLDISYFLNDYAEKIMPQDIIYIISTFTVFNLCPMIPSQEFFGLLM